MIFAVFGGDDRTVRLISLLRADGHEVRPRALELAVPDFGDTPEAAAAGADCVLLPLPAERDGLLNAPLSARSHPVDALLAGLPAGMPVLAGMAEEPLRAACRRGRLLLRDYGRREEFALANAELTAEGAVGLLLRGDTALRGSRVLIAGYGRIGRALAEKLTALGAQVTVAARRPEARLLAEYHGCRAVPFGETAGDWDAVVSTVPSPVFGAEALSGFGDARCLELASPPYGFDLATARALGRPVELASGLPGRSAPAAAAAALRDVIYHIMEE